MPCCCSGLATILLYMNWTGYEVARSLPKNTIFLGLILGSVVAVVILGRLEPVLGQAAAILAPLAIVALKLLQSRWDHNLGWMYFALHPRPFTVVPAVPILLLWLDRHRSRWAQTGLLTMIGFSLLVHLFSAHAPLQRTPELRERSVDATIVFDARRSSDRYSTSVLCDASTCHAFADFENAFHYSSLFGVMGFPERGPEVSEIDSWLATFDKIVLTESSIRELGTQGDNQPGDFGRGFEAETNGPYSVLSRVGGE